MIEELSIVRFKSIRELRLKCKRVNLFIGQPNTGKSNILESLGMLSFLYYSLFGSQAREFVRFEHTSNLFYDENLDRPVEIICGTTELTLQFKDGRFDGNCLVEGQQAANFGGSHDGLTVSSRHEPLNPFKAYRFEVKEEFARLETDFLLPPSGENLLPLLLANRELRSVVNQPFSELGLRLGIRPQEKKLEIIKQLDDIIVSYPYSLTSETLQRVTFFMAAILSNKESVLVFEEPESHAFPYYTKYLAEQIALDQRGNQYFISTHNPYFLLPIVEKSPQDDIAVFVTYYKNYETKVRQLSADDLKEMGDIDIFSNLERYLGKR